MSKLLSVPEASIADLTEGKYEKFNLKENPFPPEPYVNKDSEDRRINGDIYEFEIRRKEYESLKSAFLEVPQNNLLHLRLGFIIDESYIGRGNGKSAFLVYLQNSINKEYCIDISQKKNKCFGLYLSPEPGGKTKTFASLVDLIYKAILDNSIIDHCLAFLRFDAISESDDKVKMLSKMDDREIIRCLNDKDWLKSNDFDLVSINKKIWENKLVQTLPRDFPIFKSKRSLFPDLVTQNDFKQYYVESLKRGRDRYDFIFTNLVKLFMAANFNGAYLLVDDFERIPDFQSARQKKDFALELRQIVYDGYYDSARFGFYNVILVLHAGVQGMIEEAWGLSGMEHRAPLNPKAPCKHIIPFKKLSAIHAQLLIGKYLSEYYIEKRKKGSIEPFNKTAIARIGSASEYNASKILRMAYDLLEKAADIDEIKIIDEKFIDNYLGEQGISEEEREVGLEQAETIDLIREARKNSGQ